MRGYQFPRSGRWLDPFFCLVCHGYRGRPVWVVVVLKLREGVLVFVITRASTLAARRYQPIAADVDDILARVSTIFNTKLVVEEASSLRPLVFHRRLHIIGFTSTTCYSKSPAESTAPYSRLLHRDSKSFRRKGT